jgi:hypothetical protein
MVEIPILEPRIFKTFVSVETSIFPMDTIEYEGKFWLVPRWLESIEEGWLTPERIISLENLQVQDLRKMPSPSADFSVSVPIPKFVFDGDPEQPKAAGYRVVQYPPIRFRKPTVH